MRFIPPSPSAIMSVLCCLCIYDFKSDVCVLDPGFEVGHDFPSIDKDVLKTVSY